MRTTMTAVILLASAFVSGVRAIAADAAGFKPEYRLSEQEKERILAASAAKPGSVEPGRSAATGIDADGPPVGAGVHGEIGFGIGTGGYRSAFGTAFYPLGPGGGAMITFDIDRFGDVPKR